MPSIAAQDRPKLIAVGVAIPIALGFLARNVAATATHTQPETPAKAAMRSPTFGATPPIPPTPAVPVDEPWAAATLSAPSQQHPHDPFHPIPGTSIMKPPIAPVLIRIAALPAPGHPGIPPSRAGAVALPGGRPAPAMSRVAPAATPPPRPTRERSAAPAENPSAPVMLSGTVGAGTAAVATFHVGEETIFARPTEIVAGWRVARIEVGGVWLSRDNIRQLVRVGNSLPGGTRSAERTIAVPAS